MVSTKLLDDLIEIDDQITDFDQEDLEGIDRLLEKRFDLLNKISEDTGPEPEEPEALELEDPRDDPTSNLMVHFTDTEVLITSTIDQTVKVGGKVRDGSMKLKANKETSRKLTKEKADFVSIDGVEYKISQ